MLRNLFDSQLHLQTLESPATIVPATTSVENYMEPIPYEVS